MERYVCIHGHFYQPPRENPWLEAIEVQDSAYPYHDWNQRITAECYAPNGASRILDSQQRIQRIVNNYSKISFNFGPTLLAWMETEAKEAYEAVLTADRESRKRYSGHGSAMAQAYNHMILPLANSRDKRTQIMWGLRDFKRRFGRAPEGMWLPEAAVDLESLDIMAGLGIKFTVLSPYQAREVRTFRERVWKDVSGGRIDPSMAYRLRLPSGRNIAVFFYDGPISRAVAFEDLLSRGENLAHRLCSAFSPDRSWAQLVHIATDGETYGHHRRHADMALAYALHHIEAKHLAKLTNYGEFLAQHPPAREVQIYENSSWSCAHGVERWRSNCGCNSGGHGDWHQDWRAPLREALDWLRDRLAEHFEVMGPRLFRDPWHARDHYIEVILDHSPKTIAQFLELHAARTLDHRDRTVALKLMEMQRHAMLMYTSCGWFFDEISGIETVQIIEYAARALQLGQELFRDHLEAGFLSILEGAASNVPEHRDGRTIYEKFVRPAIVDLQKVGAHFAISSLFEDYPEKSRIYCFDVEREDFRVAQEGKIRLAMGRVKIVSRVTEESDTVSFGVLHLGDQNLSGGVRHYRGKEDYDRLTREIRGGFERGDIPELVRAVDRNFGDGTYSLRLLFRDEQRKIVNRILENALSEAAVLYRGFYGQYATLARFVADLGLPVPQRFRMAVDFALNEDLRVALSSSEPDGPRIKSLLEQVQRTGILLDQVTLEFAFRKTIEQVARELAERPGHLEPLESLDRLAAICPLLPFPVDLWGAQNVYHVLRVKRYRTLREKANRGDAKAARWVRTMDALGLKLGFSRESLAAEAGT
jgi:alpha-amylase/alpha-mannosidase (GH57 family)